MEEFLQTEFCPNYIKAETELSKQKDVEYDKGSDEEIFDENQPSWCELIQPNAVFDEGFCDFVYDDGGPNYN